MKMSVTRLGFVQVRGGRLMVVSRAHEVSTASYNRVPDAARGRQRPRVFDSTASSAQAGDTIKKRGDAMSVHTITAQMCAEDLVPPAVLRRVTDRPHFLSALSRYVAMNDDDLYRATEVCLRNLESLDEDAGPDADLRLVLVPELWERLRPGSRYPLRRITSGLAEHQGDEASIFTRWLLPESRAQLRASADDLRQRVAAAAILDARSLVEQTRFAVSGSRAADKCPPDYSLYGPGFTYRLVPAVAWRALVRNCQTLRLER